MLRALQSDAFLFGGLKTHAQLMEASTMLLEDGKVKSFDQFERDYQKLNVEYNQNYLEAEYQFAVNSSQMAANWAQLNDSGRYYLQYRTAMDDRVRDEHAQMQGITLPKDDDFWLSYYPPNGWRCRCQAVEVRKSKYEESDSTTAIEKGEKATTQIGKDGKNRLEIFRFNPGKEEKLFPPKHPYNKLSGAEKATAAIKELTSAKDLSNYFEPFASENKEYFHRGFNQIKVTNRKTVNGFTDMNGEIALRPEIINQINQGINNIRNKKPTTLEQETAISTLHHEIWHNANKPGNMRMSKDQTLTMELANEFVARKTLPDFMEKLGGKLENESLTSDRKNTAYNRMVVNYDSLIEWSGSDASKVLNTVKKHLIEEKYTEQMTGLVKGITENSEFDIEEKYVKTLIDYAKNKSFDSERFKKLLENNKKILKDRE